MTAAEAERYMTRGRFPLGSMGFKVAAALRYLAGAGNQVIITSLDRTYAVLQSDAGPRTVP